VASGHRPIFGCVHNTGSSTVAALLRSPALPLTSQVTNSGWSTDVERLVKAMFCLVDGVIRHR
jgi:hypothetical protein